MSGDYETHSADYADVRAMALDIANGTTFATWGADWYMRWAAAYLDLVGQLDALAKIGFALVHDNMHFHERAMADPFEAESYVQGVGESILEITGHPSNVTVVSSPPSEPSA